MCLSKQTPKIPLNTHIFRRAYGAAVNFVKMLVYLMYIITLTVVVASFDPRFMRIGGMQFWDFFPV